MSYAAAIADTSDLIESRVAPDQVDARFLTKPTSNAAAYLTSAYYLGLASAELVSAFPSRSDLLQGAAKAQLKKVVNTATTRTSWGPSLPAKALAIATFNPGLYWLASLAEAQATQAASVFQSWWEGEGTSNYVVDPDGSGDVNKVLAFTVAQLRANGIPQTRALNTVQWVMTQAAPAPDTSLAGNLWSAATTALATTGQGLYALGGKVEDGIQKVYNDGKAGISGGLDKMLSFYRFVVIIALIIGALFLYAIYAKTWSEAKSFT